jgi:hypothetical protein
VIETPPSSRALKEPHPFDLQGLLVMKEATNFRNDLSHGLLGDRGIGLNAIYVWWICLHLCFRLLPPPERATPPEPESSHS